MKLNKEKFLKSELGGNLQECVTAWDHWLTELRKFNIDAVGQKYRETRKAADWCQAQFEVFQTVMRQFYNIEYHFSRTDEYFGVCTEDETDWLFKVDNGEPSLIQLYHLRKIRESGGYGILLFPKDFEKFKGFNEHKSKSNAWYLSNIEEQKRWKIKLEEKEI